MDLKEKNQLAMLGLLKSHERNIALTAGELIIVPTILYAGKIIQISEIGWGIVTGLSFIGGALICLIIVRIWTKKILALLLQGKHSDGYSYFTGAKWLQRFATFLNIIGLVLCIRG
jgi:hypothetical protein